MERKLYLSRMSDEEKRSIEIEREKKVKLINLLMEEKPWYIVCYKDFKEMTVLGSDYLRKDIKKIIFRNTLKNEGENSWDVSSDQNNSIKAWVKDGVLYIGANGDIHPSSCYSLFADYVNATEIEFNGCFKTTKITDMRWMFKDCRSLKVLDLRGFDTINVSDMRGMFFGCNIRVLVGNSGINNERLMLEEERRIPELRINLNANIRLYEDKPVFTMRAESDTIKRILGSVHLRSNIKKIIFLNTLENEGENSWDVSSDQDNSVKAWVRSKVLYIGANGYIQPLSCEGLFQGYMNLEEIEFNGCFCTGNVTNMSNMFRGCLSLKELDTSEFDTKSVRDMSGMFFNCSSLNKLDLSGFDMRNVILDTEMLVNCPAKKSRR